MKNMKIAVLLATVISLTGLLLACPTSSSNKDDKSAPKPDDYSIIGLVQDVKAGSEIEKVTITPKAGTDAGAVSSILYGGQTWEAYSAALPTEDATVAVTFDTVATETYKAGTRLSAGTLHIYFPNEEWAPPPVATDYNIVGINKTYYTNDPSEKKVTITNKVTGSAVGITVYYTLGTNGTKTTEPPTTTPGTYNVTFDVARDATAQVNGAKGLVAGLFRISDPTGLQPPDEADFELVITKDGATVTTVQYGDTFTFVVKPKEGKDGYGAVSNVLATYQPGTGEAAEAPTATPHQGGTYKVTFDVEEGTVYGDATDLYAGPLTIAPKTLTAADFTLEPTQPVYYDGTAKTVTVTPKKMDEADAFGQITRLYNNSATAPTAVGTYNVSVTVTASRNNNAVTTAIAVGTLVIRETPGTFSASNANEDNYLPIVVHTGSTLTPSVGDVTYTPSAPGSTPTPPLRVGSDITIEYSDNIDPGTATVTIKGKLGSDYADVQPLTLSFDIGVKINPSDSSVFSYLWVGQNDDLKATFDASYPAPTNLTFVVPAGYTLVSLVVNGVKQGNVTSYNFTTRGAYSVALVVSKGGRLYSGDYSIVVH